MADFPVCPSSERTESELPPFCLGAVKPGRFCRKVVSANLFADTLPKSIDCTAQSLRPYGPAPFTQGSLSVYPPACLNCPPNSNLPLSFQSHPHIKKPPMEFPWEVCWYSGFSQDSSSLSSASSEPEALLNRLRSCSTVRFFLSSPLTSTTILPSYIITSRLP